MDPQERLDPQDHQELEGLRELVGLQAQEVHRGLVAHQEQVVLLELGDLRAPEVPQALVAHQVPVPQEPGAHRVLEDPLALVDLQVHLEPEVLLELVQLGVRLALEGLLAPEGPQEQEVPQETLVTKDLPAPWGSKAILGFLATQASSLLGWLASTKDWTYTVSRQLQWHYTSDMVPQTTDNSNCFFDSLFRLSTKKHQNSVSLSLCVGNHPWRQVDSTQKGPVMRKIHHVMMSSKSFRSLQYIKRNVLTVMLGFVLWWSYYWIPGIYHTTTNQK